MKQKLLLLMITMLMIAGCGGKQNTETNTHRDIESNTASLLDKAPALGSEERIQLNQAAGEITYITGFYYAASPPDIQVVLADELGYFEALGLKVKIVPGLDAEGMKFLAANQAQIASSGTPSQVIQSVAQGAEISGIATFGGVGTSALLVMEDSDIHEPADLKGKTIGYHGALPANLIAMLQNSGMNVTDVKGVSVGYDPTILSNGTVDALTVYKSNEPYQLEKLGERVRVIDPGQFGAETSFGVIAVNNEWANTHPTAVQDFLRAAIYAHNYATQHPKEAVEVLNSRSETVYDVEAELNRWQVELSLLASSKHDGHGIGWQTEDQWIREIEMLKNADVITKEVKASEVMNNAFLESIYDGDNLKWSER